MPLERHYQNLRSRHQSSTSSVDDVYTSPDASSNPTQSSSSSITSDSTYVNQSPHSSRTFESGFRLRIDRTHPLSPEAPSSWNVGSQAGPRSTYQTAFGGHDLGPLDLYNAYAIPKQTSSLCDLCRHIFASWPQVLRTRHRIFKHHSNRNEVTASARKGCRLCAQLSQDGMIRKHEVKIRDSTQGLVIVSCMSSGLCQIAWQYKADGDIGNPDYASSVTLIQADSKIQRPSYEQEYFKSTLDALPSCVRWLAKCLHSHKSCNIPTSTRMPTRLIYLDDNTISLRLSSELDAVPRYATLSHCWGNKEFITLTTTNLAQFRKSIPLKDLPKTFKDAIYVARELGFRYVWIDSMCILQNCASDWATESHLMSDVYGNSSINIAASGAVDGTRGLFFDRESSWKCYVQTTSSDGPISYDCVPGYFNTILQESPLSKRGWALQERILPRRSLHFTDREVFWECDEVVACETFPDGIPEAAPFVKLKKRPMDYGMWNGLIERYSRCRLTHNKDKLIAISGLAKIAQKELDDHYLAGMWREDLELQLGWYTPRIAKSSEEYVAPSWSWASIIGAVELDDLDFEPDLILCVKVVNVVETPYDAVRHTVLHLNCKYVLQAVITYDAYSRTNSKADIMLEGKWKIHSTIFLDSLDNRETHDIEACLVPIHASKDFGYVSGLILSPKDESRYQRRLGIFKITHKQSSGPFESAAKSVFREGYGARSSSVLRDERGTKQYIVHII